MYSSKHKHYNTIPLS